MSRELSETHEKHRISVAEIAKKEEQLVVLKVRSQVRRGGGQLVAVYFYKVFWETEAISQNTVEPHCITIT